MKHQAVALGQQQVILQDSLVQLDYEGDLYYRLIAENLN